MTGSIREIMRHIPEEELHAYLDQALSRSQCVEIESHLAACAACRRDRDGIAALRDRTTALLATLAPPRRFTPALDLLQERASVRSARVHRVRRAAVWAATIVIAVGLGWGANTYSRPGARSDATPSPRAPAVATSNTAPLGDTAVQQAAGLDGVARPTTLAGVASMHTETVRHPRTPIAAAPKIIEPPRVEVSTAKLPTTEFESTLGGMWRTLSWDGAQRERGDSVPHIDGLPVVEVQVGQTRAGHNKSIMVVAQQLASGEVIRTIEGPAADVSQLLGSRQGVSNPTPWPTADSPGIAGGEGTMAMRFGDRMLAITAQLPNDSLRAMMRRLNVEMRAK